MKRMLKQNFDHWIQLKMLKKTKNADRSTPDIAQRHKKGRKAKNFSKNEIENDQKELSDINDFSGQDHEHFDYASAANDQHFEPPHSRRIDFKIQEEPSALSPMARSSQITQSIVGYFIRRSRSI
jgi:hypothetical protein